MILDFSFLILEQQKKMRRKLIYFQEMFVECCVIHSLNGVKYFQEFRAKLANLYDIALSDNATLFLGVQFEQDRFQTA
jgi:hypothetical protein